MYQVQRLAVSALQVFASVCAVQAGGGGGGLQKPAGQGFPISQARVLMYQLHWLVRSAVHVFASVWEGQEEEVVRASSCSVGAALESSAPVPVPQAKRRPLLMKRMLAALRSGFMA